MATDLGTITTDLFQPIGAAVETVDHTLQTPESAGDPQVVDNIESLCMHCEEQGITRLFLTSIPYFKEVVLMSFECPHCGYRNSEIQSVPISPVPFSTTIPPLSPSPALLIYL